MNWNSGAVGLVSFGRMVVLAAYDGAVSAIFKKCGLPLPYTEMLRPAVSDVPGLTSAVRLSRLPNRNGVACIPVSSPFAMTPLRFSNSFTIAFGPGASANRFFLARTFGSQTCSSGTYFALPTFVFN